MVQSVNSLQRYRVGHLCVSAASKEAAMPNEQLSVNRCNWQAYLLTDSSLLGDSLTEMITFPKLPLFIAKNF